MAGSLSPRWVQMRDEILFYSVFFIMWAYRKKNDSFIRQIFTKTKFTALDIAAFFTNNKDDTKIPVNPDTAASDQV